MDTFTQRYENDIFGLQWIHHFGWLRSQELGRFMWPGDKYARTRTDRVVRGWMERNYVIQRALPDGCGHCYVLSKLGATLLNIRGIEAAQTGKDLGTHTDKGWSPPASWAHDLISAGVLGLFAEHGIDTCATDRDIRAALSRTTRKLPDGILKLPSGEIGWLEVESARKTGQAMQHLAQAAYLVSGNKMQPILDLKPSVFLLAYPSNIRDERGCMLSHRARVTSAIQKHAVFDTMVSWVKCEMGGRGARTVISIESEPERIFSARALRLLEEIEAHGWEQDKNEISRCYVRGQTLATWLEDDQGSWAYQVNEQAPKLVDSEEEAKSRAVRDLANLMWN